MTGRRIQWTNQLEEKRRLELMLLPEAVLRRQYLRISGRRGRTSDQVPETLISRDLLCQLIILYERHD